MTYNDDNFDNFLRTRSFTPARQDLASYILRNAQMVDPKKRLSVFDILRNIFREFNLPEPAYVLSFLLLLGFLTGIGLQSLHQKDNYNSYDIYNTVTIQNYLHAGENVL